MRVSWEFDSIGEWSEIKLEIVRDYAAAYSRILSKQHFHHVYIDGFSGPGVHLSRAKGELVPGSPLNALAIQPPFREFFLVDLDGDKVDRLRAEVGADSRVHVLHGDCNEVLLDRVFPKVQWSDFRRGLCLLDPYGLQLDWEVMKKAGELKTIDLFLNFPVMDMNRNALRTRPDRVSSEQAARMTAFWGDESWRTAAYRLSPQLGLFGPQTVEKVDNEEVAEAFRCRLHDVAGFANVPRPLPMRNSTGAVVYYLFFASQKGVANEIVEQIFGKYREHGA